MRTIYVYVEEASGVVFRVVRPREGFMFAKLDGVNTLTLSVTEDDYQQLLNGRREFTWTYLTKLKRSYPQSTGEKSRALDVLSAKCEALEALYRTVNWFRERNYPAFKFSDVIDELRFNEAQAWLRGSEFLSVPFLSDYAAALGLTLNEAARLIMVTYTDFKEVLRRSERIKLTWEEKIKNSSDPWETFEEMKDNVYILL